MLETNFSPFPILKSERLVLRALKLKDTKEIFALRTDARVNVFVDRPATKNLTQAKEFIKKIQKAILLSESMYWVITFNHEFVGTICLWNLDFENDIAEIGYELKYDAQGEGFMNEAIREVINFALNTMQVKRITAFPKSKNVKSIRLLEKNNFVLDNAFENGSELDANGYLVYYLSESTY